ncbi:hypothetical protein [Parvicella tangerina]|uniref:Uncharacterized protein n=1 Tax=Parvicella tangerina TaxID=2829795 RepID=A0A916NPN9_9FLAO|nr:hypothetical protein [Parvicella tangerina]CAG5077109.1 hypothetical protein CRYO30217_00293 [Parvicella tangerina]
MLEIGLVIGAAVGFFKLAQNNGLTAWVWALLAVVGYLGGAFVVGLLIGLFAPEMLNDRLSLTLLGLVSGGIGILIVYLLLKLQIKRKENEVEDGDILDDDLNQL